MSRRNADIAESIIKLEAFTFALAIAAGKAAKDGDLREARKLLKGRIEKELDAAEARGKEGKR